jgi:hypothetical protein
MPSYTQVTTNNGLTALNASWAGEALIITRVDVGSGSVANPLTATALGDEQIHSVGIAGEAITSSGSFAISIVVNNAAVTTPFSMTEIGIWGTSGGGAEELLVYISDSEPETIPPNTVVNNSYVRLGIGSANTANVTINITPGFYALESTFISHLADPGAHPQAFQNPANLANTTKDGTLTKSTGTGAAVLVDTTTPSFVSLYKVLPHGQPLLTNGDLSYQDRTTPAGTVGSGGYIADNWKAIIGGSGSPGNNITGSWNAWDGLFTPDASFRYPRGFVRFQSTTAISPAPSAYFDLATYVEGKDLSEAVAGPMCVSFLIRASSAINILAYLNSGDGTQYYGNTVFVNTSWQRVSFVVSSWPGSLQTPFALDTTGLGLMLAIRLMCGAAAAVPTTNNAWTSSTGSPSAPWNPFTSNGAYIDIADVRSDVLSSFVQVPLFESESALERRCLRLWEAGITMVGSIFSVTGTNASALGSANYRVGKRNNGSNITCVSSGGSETVELTDGTFHSVTSIGSAGNPFGFNQINFTANSSYLGFGFYCLVTVDGSF